ncbi:MAG: rod-binding protein [Planctomycetaceae bacterium]|nr:rod-binding protein [Planctomycetaceae bacterium]
MNISPILTAPHTNFATKTSAEKTGGDFASMLKNAINNRKSSVDTADTFEYTSEGKPPVTRNTARLDTNGQPFDAATRTEADDEEFRKVFHQFVGQTMFGQMLKSMRATQQKVPYFHGGRTEEIFQEQLDNVLVDKMTAATPHSFSDTLFKLMK